MSLRTLCLVPIVILLPVLSCPAYASNEQTAVETCIRSLIQNSAFWEAGSAVSQALVLDSVFTVTLRGNVIIVAAHGRETGRPLAEAVCTADAAGLLQVLSVRTLTEGEGVDPQATPNVVAAE